MVYSWRIPGMYDVPAQVAGEELSRIYRKRGKMDASDVVDESRPESAPLHTCFEWNNATAAEKYREHQARSLIHCVITKAEAKSGEAVEVRAFSHVLNTYRPLDVILKSNDMDTEMRETVLREFLAFKRKLETYKSLDAVQQVIKAIDRAEGFLKNDCRQAPRYGP